ncbi:serine/threonine-protein kinase [Spartinivicinus ruber]|uniref:serine/threonine-protein kinase n=1 Tax=Spartinivicinus ruber TaxID=2683272 RepID=UPI0013D4C9BC|nr:serine/threonine-protein kinase [Spartinivicinus ruber]
MASDNKTQHKKIKLGSKYEVPTNDADVQPTGQQSVDEDKNQLVDSDKTQLVGDDKTVVIPPHQPSQAQAADHNIDEEDKTIVTGKYSTNVKNTTTVADEATVVSKPDQLSEVVGQAATGALPEDITQLSGKPITSQPLTHSSNPSGGPRRATIRVGSVLKERFELVKILGSGGMGVVYKALDRRKQEANDRQPYVAIKVLNEEFRQHPESLVALQRESSKAQELAHPNIATVYDFDRENDVVFMTMEWLQGKALDELIREDYPDGMPMQKVLKIARGVANGLSYAHKRGIIHSDFKPSNVFVVSDGTAKVFDFGIARAVSSQAHGEGEQTLFDAGQLGALTPAYASLEMLLGQEPDIRDDLYAFACVIYECITGTHPFKKLSALKAREEKKQPAKIKQLSSNRWKALASALAFNKENRPKTVDEFINAFAGQPKRRALTLVGVLMALMLGAAPVGYNMVKSILADQRANEVIRAIHQLPSERALEAFNLIEQEEPNVQEKVIDEAKKTILELLEAKAMQQVSKEEQRFDFVGARNVISQGNRYYPDSAQLNALFDKIQARQDQLINYFYQEFNVLLDENKIYPKESERDVLDIIAVVRKIDPEHVMLSDPRLAIAYSEAASEAIRSGKIDLADKILATAILLYPEDKRLIDLVDRVRVVRGQNTQGVDRNTIAAILANNSIETIKQEIEQMLRQPFSHANWGLELEQKYEAIKSKLTNGDDWLMSTQQQMALTYLEHAKQMRQAKRYSAARNDLKKAYNLAPNLFGLADEQAILKASEAAYKTELQASNRAAQVKVLKTQFAIQVKARDEKGAESSYRKLRRLLGASDKFMLKDALEQMAKLYYNLAEHHAKAGDKQQASRFIKKGLQYHPNSRLLLKAKESYQ